MKQLLQAENIDDKRWPARMLAGLIDGWKNRGLTPSQVPAGEAAMFGNGKGGKLYASYQERLKILNAADFGDLLLENIRLFREHPDVLRQYQNRFKFILVDEYQDTNVAQYLWLRLLSQAPSRPGVPLSAIIPGAIDSPVIPGRVEGVNPMCNRRCEESRVTRTHLEIPGLALVGAPRNDGEMPRRPPPPSKTSAASATTTSRSMAGAARRSTTSCASITIFPAPKSSASNAITAPPAISSPPPRI